MRADKSFKCLIAEVKLEFIKKGKRVPNTKTITKVIAKKINREEILNYEQFIRFI